MRALVYHGPKSVSVDEVADAKIERPTDALIKITTTKICGSDLHMYEGRTDVEEGNILGHENVGEVIEVGDGVDRVKVGDMVCLPFNIGCGPDRLPRTRSGSGRRGLRELRQPTRRLDQSPTAP
jgi:glutathione-independent formaldehyde dehydrogenase